MRRFLLQMLINTLLLTGAGTVVAQINYSKITQFNNVNGENTIIRTNRVFSHFVTCSNTSDGRSCFVVDNGSSYKFFYTTQHVTMIPGVSLNTGYVVKDMQMEFDGTTCWFCGIKWAETGTLVYDINGSGTWDTVFCGFIGRFDAVDVMNGSGSFEIMEIDGTYCLDKLAAWNTGAAAVGIDDYGRSRVVELIQSGTNTYKYKVEKSTRTDEVFMDIANANGRIVTLSRFNSSISNSYFKNYFGLRYGNPSYFVSTSSTLYLYNTANVFGNNAATFTSMNPVHLSYTNKDKEVVVSYLGDYFSAFVAPWLKGHLLSYHIPSEGANNITMTYNQDTNTYRKIYEVKFNQPLTTKTYMAALLEGSDGNSVLRFPYLNRTNAYNDTMLYINYAPKVESVAPYQTSSSGMEIAATGRYHYSYQRIVDIREYEIHDHLSMWNNNNCFFFFFWTFKPVSFTSGSTETCTLQVVNSEQNCHFSQFSFTSTTPDTSLKCYDGHNVN